MIDKIKMYWDKFKSWSLRKFWVFPNWAWLLIAIVGLPLLIMLLLFLFRKKGKGGLRIKKSR
jgi:hypothetical protein